MDLVVSGMSLSLQRIPSTSYYAENLVAERDDPPVMVEHPGEVILQAVRSVDAIDHQRLVILHTGAVPEYGSYISQLDELFVDVHLGKTSSPALIDSLKQAEDLVTKDPDLMVVISETTSTGTSAIALSLHKQDSGGLVRLVMPGTRTNEKLSFELGGFSGDLEKEGFKYLGDLSKERSGGRPIRLSAPGAYRQPKESILSLMHLILAIKTKVLPAWNPPQDINSLINLDDSLVVNHQPVPWLATGQYFLRSGVLVGKAQSPGGWQSIQIIDIPSQVDLNELRHIKGVDPYLFIISGKTQTELIDRLDQLESALKERITLPDLALNAYTQYSAGHHELTCCLLAPTREALAHEIQHAKTGVPAGLSSQKEWTSPSGSYFTPQPLGAQEVAFVYPGAFNSYPGMGRGLFFSFPGLQDAALEIIPDLSHSLAEDILYPAGSTETDKNGFYNYPGKLIESGISLSALYTLILERVYGVKPSSAFGYSLGENSMLWANHVWHDARESSNSWQNSNLFTDQLAGKMQVVRDAWEDETLPDHFWDSYILKANADLVMRACEKEDHVSLTIQNTPDEVVIAGEKNACMRIIKDLECHALPMPFNAAMHHPAMKSSQDSFESLFSNPTTPRDDIRFYSAASYDRLTLNQGDLARAMAEMTCDPFDFPKLVNRVYQDGARIFIEVGPQKTCTRWIEKILKGKPHAVIPLNKKYQADLHGIFKVISLLLSHGAELDLTSLFPAPVEKPATQDERPEISTYQAEVPQLHSRQPARVLQFTENLDRISADMAAGHKEFLTQQAVLTRSLTRVLELQARAAGAGTRAKSPSSTLYTRDQIKAFTNGDHRICFGDQFAGFGNRRFPRLPNGPLQLIDRVIQIDGKAGVIQAGSALISEVDLADSAWYKPGKSAKLPHVALMEIALQPCGFLSAYMGSTRGREDQDLYFRNLDGEAKLLFWPNPSKQTITNKVSLISSSNLDDVIIQKYSFELFQGGDLFFGGTSSFGYFPHTMLQNQAGLNGHKSAATWKHENPQNGNWQQIQHSHLGEVDKRKPHLPRVEKVWIAPRGGVNNQGYIYSEEDIPENAWFFQAHFYQDPVMPGSLGVEWMARSLMAAAPQWNIPPNLVWRTKTGSSIRWKYRGQITPDNPGISLEMHLKSITQGPGGWEICADGHLWKDDQRIYQIDNLCLESMAAD